MGNRLEDWAQQAVEQMWFLPDRKRVRKELLDHMEDARDSMLERGFSAEQAQQDAVAAMGDARVVGKALNKAHKPVLGWLWFLSRWACAAMVTALVFGVLYGGLDVDVLFPEDLPFLREESRGLEQGTPLQSGLTMKEGDYTVVLHHGVFCAMEENLSMELGFQIYTDQLWQVWPRGLDNLHAEFSTGKIGWEQNRDDGLWMNVQVEDSMLPVWKAVVFLEGWSEEPVEWVRFYVPDTDLDFTVYPDGEVRR